MAYITQADVKKYLGANWSATLVSFVDLTITQVTAYVENFCGNEEGKRMFEADNTAVTRHFDGNGQGKIEVGDLREISSLVVDKVTLVENEDYYLYPLNAPAEGKPYEWIELVQPETRLNANSRIAVASPYVFEVAQRNVVVTGKWGYSTTPPAEISLAVMKLTGGVLKENISDNDIREITKETLGDYTADYRTVDKVAHALSVTDLLAPFVKKGGGRTGASVMKGGGGQAGVTRI